MITCVYKNLMTLFVSSSLDNELANNYLRIDLDGCF